ncbi:hypothetical protein [Streptomyces sp. NBC_01445]|uniref:hypothetical protein n=1 Tax=Streptomyces sp. NBC_01445 TaxID=2903869 RepID=UPI002DDAD76F|nr:hypothetical protein [Streptomyces sp. NBC_01445]
MRPFGPPHSPGRVAALRGEIVQLTKGLAEDFQEGRQIDVVADFDLPAAHHLICRLLGVPPEDEHLFHAWTAAIIAGADIGPVSDTTERDRASRQARQELGQYLVGLAEQVVAGPPAICSPTSSTNRTPPCSSPKWNWRPPPSCCSSPDTRPRSI